MYTLHRSSWVIVMLSYASGDLPPRLDRENEKLPGASPERRMAARTALWVVALLGLQLAGEGVSASHVLELNSSNIDAALSAGVWLVEFYAPWCGYCRRLEPVYEQVAEELQEDFVKVARVDGSAFKALGARFGVQGFPTIFHINNGDIRKYAGDRSKDSLVIYAAQDFAKQPLSFSPTFSPLGTLGRIFGAILEATVALQENYERARKYLDLSHPWALGLVALLTAVTGSILGLIVSVIFPERDPPPRAQAAQGRKRD